MSDRNGMTNSDELDFWALHIPHLRGVGYEPDPEPAPAPVAEPDLTGMSMSMEEFAKYRAKHGIDSSDFIGVRPWRYRHLPTNNE